ncbi:hypothetical protein [Streptomyces sp. NPDC092129]|uniref:hypothetical protein n=1 Tax=Streptomyces sp. NPDC092129 TaxID=3366010 RepID=UPI003826B552
MDELEFMRGRVYGADYEYAGPRHGRVYAELVAGPLDGLHEVLRRAAAYLAQANLTIVTDGESGRLITAVGLVKQ